MDQIIHLPEGAYYTSSDKYSGLSDIKRSANYGNSLVDNAKFGVLKNRKISSTMNLRINAAQHE